MIEFVDVGVTPSFCLSNEEVAEDDKEESKACEEPTRTNAPSCAVGVYLKHVRNGEEEDPAHNVVGHETQRLSL